MKSSAMSVKFKEGDVEKVRSALSGVKGGAPKVLVRSLNKTVAGVKTDASSEIRKELNARKSTVDATIKLKRATVGNISAAFQTTGKPMPLIGFIGTRQTKRGVSVMVTKTGGRRIIPSAFITTVRSAQQRQAGIEGHKGVFWRTDARYSGSKSHQSKLVKKPRNPHGKIMVQRLPIKELYAPRVSDYLDDKKPIMQTVLRKAEDRLHTNIERELNFELSKL